MPDAAMSTGAQAGTWATTRSREDIVEITGIISAIVFGAVIGGLGRAVVPGRHRLSLLATILVGVVGAVLGTGVAELIDVAETDGVDWTEIAMQVVFAGGGVSLLSRARSRQSQ
jgi:uncharacterized membrane protein YeaQ/YmgE (transglycosylase-associated protein family)